MSNGPITNASVKVVCPATAMQLHGVFQQLIPKSQLGSGKDSTIIVLQLSDLKRLFGDLPVASFYIIDGDYLSYIALRSDHASDGGEIFANFFHLDQDLLDKAISESETCGFWSIGNFTEDVNVGDVYGVLPKLRMKILIPSENFPTSPVSKCVALIEDYEDWKQANVEYKFDGSTAKWVPNTDPVEEIVEKKRIHLKDIPLNTRNGRRLVRNSIEEALVTLTDLHMRSASQLSFDEWMTQSQGVHMKALRDLEVIDIMSDEQYVEAMVTFKKAEAQAYHSQAVKDKKTDLHLFDWVLENFGQEFNDLGRKEAEAEVQDFNMEPSPADAEGDSMKLPTGDDEFIPAVFLVTFDGTIVEDQQPLIGPESPFALPTLRKLIELGHQVIIFSWRQNKERQEMLDYLRTSNVVIAGSTTEFPADGIVITEEWLDSVHEEHREHVVDYFIDHRQFAAPMIQISGRTNGGNTFYWGDLVSQLAENGYLSDDDIQEIMVNMDPEANQ